MKVYHVLWIDYDDEFTGGVFSTREKADERVAFLSQNGAWERTGWQVVEYDVDSISVDAPPKEIM